MSRLRDVRERIHQPQFDTLVRGIGQSKVGAQKRLFGNATVGDRGLTNMLVPGQLAADQTYILRAMRCAMMFQSLSDDAFGPTGSSDLPDYAGTAVSSQAQAEDLYFLCAYGAYFTLEVGQKSMLTAPLWYIPAGGGPAGFTTVNSRHVITNGLATQESILRLAKDITFAARQNFSVTIEWFDFATLNPGTSASGVAYPGDLSPLQYLNVFDGIKMIQVHVDGVLTRDVQ